MKQNMLIRQERYVQLLKQTAQLLMQQKAAEVTAEKAATGVEVTDTLTYEGLVPEKVYSVTGELL